MVAIFAIASIVKARHEGNLKVPANSVLGRIYGPDPAEEAERQRHREEVQALKERVAVLERIVTDSGSSLDREIERLR